ncbi:MAG: hypothetical protein SOU07_02125 [Bacilli bacterium]|nr:hypothetical protein [Acholeplasmataceae bacterium]MDY2902227.1 hypothetical protein [Bacilli bacterium]
MIKPYFTRKNLIKLSLAFFYSFILLFTGLCLEGSHSFASKKNPIALLGNALNFKSIECGISGYVCLILVAIYISVFVGVFLYEKQYAKVNNKKVFSLKMIITYVLSLLTCLVLSLGVGLLIQSPMTKENLGNVLLFVWQSILLATCIYVFLFALIGGVLMFVVNFILVDKPFKSVDQKELPEFDDEENNTDVTANFDTPDNMSVNASGIGTGVVSGGGEAQSITRQAETLDDRSKVFPALSTMDEEYSGYVIEKVETDNITLNELCERFRNYLAQTEKLYFDIDTIRFFISGFGTSHFTILEGLSGTGKSSLPRYFAKFIKANCLFIPVQATWRDKTNLIGYFSDFSKSYSETDFLTTLYHANYNPDMIHIFVLDEMNISRVEYYFADFLSVLEYPEDEWKIRVMQLPYGFIPPAKLDNGLIQIPNNSYFVGTANKDDSTFTITDKVYDRAITIDFEDRNDAFLVEGDASPVNLSNSKLQELYNNAKANESFKMTDKDFEKFTKITSFIKDEFDITFGNRILTQIEEIVPIFVSCGGKKEDALDFLLSRKVISKIEGRFEDYVKVALKELLTLINKTYGANVLKRSEQTINSILRRL